MRRLTKLVMGLALTMSAYAASAQAEEPRAGMRPFAAADVYRTFDIKRYEKNFAQTLSHPVPMIVESALAQVVMLKLSQPQAACTEWRNRIGILAQEGATPGVRYKAYLATMAFDQPEQFAHIPSGTYRTIDDMFMALADEVQRVAFTSRDVQ